MIEQVTGGTIDWEWDGSRSSNGSAKTFRCTCDKCKKTLYRAKGNITLSLQKRGVLGCFYCCRRLGANQSAINKAWTTHIRSARSRNMFQGLTKEEWFELTTSACFYCGVDHSVDTKTKSGNSFKRNGIDRVHNEVGYTVDNCVPCCRCCNIAKSTQTQEDFIEMCRRVVRLHP